jgi:hypothetical protein
MVKLKLLSMMAINAVILMISAQSTIALNRNTTDTKKKVRNSKILHVIPYRDENSVKMPDVHHESSIQATHNGMKLNRHDTRENTINNAEMLETLGLSKLTISPNHHRKRLAVESRHHSRPDDSHMFVIKLPPNPYYYSYSKPTGDNSINDNSKHIPVGFKSNGKPGKIYHWNIPILKKMYGSTQSKNHLRHGDDSDFYDIKNTPTWSAKSSWDNDTMDKKPMSKLAKENDKILKKKSPTYYAPKPRNIQNHFAGNGKPQSFYVIEKSHKPAKYHKLIA